MPENSSREIRNKKKAVKEFLFTYILENGKHPTYQQIADATCITLATCWKYVKELTEDEIFDFFKSQQIKVFQNIVNTSSFSAASQKLYLQFFKNFKEKSEVDATLLNKTLQIEFVVPPNLEDSGSTNEDKQ